MYEICTKVNAVALCPPVLCISYITQNTVQKADIYHPAKSIRILPRNELLNNIKMRVWILSKSLK